MYSKDWNKLLNDIDNFSIKPTWFRGNNSNKFKLVTGLYREDLGNPLSYIATEKMYYNTFKRMGHLIHNSKSWDLLFIMQHHGVKTRLLDWSESFATALFFAYENWGFKGEC